MNVTINIPDEFITRPLLRLDLINNEGKIEEIYTRLYKEKDDIHDFFNLNYEIINEDKNICGMDQTAKKKDEGKLQIHLVPTQIIRDIAEIRMYGNEKYGDPDNWKSVSPVRYRDALARHFLAYLDNPESIDKESGKKHLKHMACNIAFLCAMENGEDANDP